METRNGARKSRNRVTPSVTASYAGRLPMDDKENEGVCVQRQSVRGSIRQPQKSMSKPKWTGSVVDGFTASSMQAARASARVSEHGFRHAHGGYATCAPARNLARSRVSIAPAPQPARLREVRASEANTCSLHHRTPFVPAQIKPNPQRRDSIRGGFLPLAANEVQDGRCGAVRSIEDSSGVGCRTVVVIDGRQLPSGAKWTTRSPQQHTASFCTLALRSNFHKDVLVKVTFADAASMPARVRMSHTSSTTAGPENFALLAEMSVAKGAPDQLAHTLQVGRTRRVEKFIRLEFTGLVLPARAAGGLLAAHKVARLEVTGAPFKLEKPLSPQSSERCSSPLLQNSTRTDKPVASAASQLRILREMPTVVASPVNEELATTEELAESVRHESSVAAEPAVAHHSQHHLQALSSLDCALSQLQVTAAASQEVDSPLYQQRNNPDHREGNALAVLRICSPEVQQEREVATTLEVGVFGTPQLMGAAAEVIAESSSMLLMTPVPLLEAPPAAICTHVLQPPTHSPAAVRRAAIAKLQARARRQGGTSSALSMVPPVGSLSRMVLPVPPQPPSHLLLLPPQTVPMEAATSGDLCNKPQPIQQLTDMGLAAVAETASTEATAAEDPSLLLAPLATNGASFAVVQDDTAETDAGALMSSSAGNKAAETDTARLDAKVCERAKPAAAQAFAAAERLKVMGRRQSATIQTATIAEAACSPEFDTAIAVAVEAYSVVTLVAQADTANAAEADTAAAVVAEVDTAAAVVAEVVATEAAAVVSEADIAVAAAADTAVAVVVEAHRAAADTAAGRSVAPVTAEAEMAVADAAEADTAHAVVVQAEIAVADAAETDTVATDAAEAHSAAAAVVEAELSVAEAADSEHAYNADHVIPQAVRTDTNTARADSEGAAAPQTLAAKLCQVDPTSEHNKQEEPAMQLGGAHQQLQEQEGEKDPEEAARNPKRRRNRTWSNILSRVRIPKVAAMPAPPVPDAEAQHSAPAAVTLGVQKSDPSSGAAAAAKPWAHLFSTFGSGAACRVTPLPFKPYS